MTSSAVGSIAVAPSDPNVIYAGTGETAIRLDVSYGDGLYKSSDAGRSWSHVGLRNSKFIGRICIHPQNPDLVYAAVLGDVFGPHAERGVYRSKDGGTRWRMVPPNGVLMHRPRYYNHVLGDPGHGDTVYVTNLEMWKSTDGGASSAEVTTRHGDNHDLWIDSKDPSRMIEGNDGGANIS